MLASTAAVLAQLPVQCVPRAPTVPRKLLAALPALRTRTHPARAIPSVLHARMVSTLQQELARAPTALRASTWYPVRDARLV